MARRCADQHDGARCSDGAPGLTGALTQPRCPGRSAWIQEATTASPGFPCGLPGRPPFPRPRVCHSRELATRLPVRAGIPARRPGRVLSPSPDPVGTYSTHAAQPTMRKTKRLPTPWRMAKPAAKQFALLQVEGADPTGKGAHAVCRLALAAETQADLQQAPRRVDREFIEQLSRIRNEFGLTPLPDFEAHPYS